MPLYLTIRELMILIANIAVVWTIARALPSEGWTNHLAFALVVASTPVCYAVLIRMFDRPHERARGLSQASASLLVFSFFGGWFWLYEKQSDEIAKQELASVHRLILTIAIPCFLLWLAWLPPVSRRIKMLVRYTIVSVTRRASSNASP